MEQKKPDNPGQGNKPEHVPPGQGGTPPGQDKPKPNDPAPNQDLPKPPEEGEITTEEIGTTQAPYPDQTLPGQQKR